MKIKQHASMSKVAAVVRPTLPKLHTWDYLLAQITTPVQDETQNVKHERVYNFLHVPQKLEQV
jgi:hypothetical protein